MPFTHLLDSSVYSQPLKRAPDPAVIQRWQALGDAALVTSAVCEAEILYGIRKLRRRDNLTKIHERYACVLQGRYDVLPVDYAVAEAYAELRDELESQGISIAHADLLIAATAKANNLIVATLNVRHFQVIPGITTEDWSQPLP